MGARNDEENEAFLRKKPLWKHIRDVGLKRFLKERDYWDPIKSTLKFLTHFGIVMAALYCSAMFLALVEDPIPDPTPTSTPAKDKERYETFSSQLQKEFSGIQKEFSEPELKKLMKKMKTFADKEASLKKSLEKPKSQHFLFMKWLYFVTITTTTIGYGDVSPKTDSGKLFCVFFLVIGIILMMSLMARCGNIISNANMKLYRWFNRRILKEQELVTKELLSMLTICIIFVGYLTLGILYAIMSGTVPGGPGGGGLLDMIYFWIVTFTTCGYGDILFTLEEEVAHIIPHTIYRLFGLAILAAIIDALVAYLMELKRLELAKLEGKFPKYKLGDDDKDTFSIQYANPDFQATE